MATLEQAEIYHEVRGFTPWASFATKTPQKAEALLEDAELYISATYNIRTDLSETQQGTLDGLVCRLAGIFLTTPPADTAVASIKKQSSELKGIKKEVEYNQAGPDPYPYITAVVRTLTVQTSGFSLGRMRRR